jgi:hypothetical protein
MPARVRRKPIDPEEYARLVAASLPIPPRSEADNERLIELLSTLDERKDLPPEEQTFAELVAIVVEDFEDKHYALAAESCRSDSAASDAPAWPIVRREDLGVAGAQRDLPR